MSGSDFPALWAARAPYGLAAPVPEYRFHPTRGWRFDYAWPAERVGCEFAGGRREKLNVAAALGWRVLRFSRQALATDPAGCVALVAAALVLGQPGAPDDEEV